MFIYMSCAARCPLARVFNFFILQCGPRMPEVCKCAQLPATYFPPLVPALEGHGDV